MPAWTAMERGNPNIEARNSKQIQNSNVPIGLKHLNIGTFVLVSSFDIRFSCFPCYTIPTMFGFGGNKKQSYLGVDIGAGGIKVAELTNEKGRAALMTYGYSALPGAATTV